MDNQEVAVNLIITDYCMPGMTGYDLLKKIKVATVFSVCVSWYGPSMIHSRQKDLKMYACFVQAGINISKRHPSGDHVIREHSFKDQ